MRTGPDPTRRHLTGLKRNQRNSYLPSSKVARSGAMSNGSPALVLHMLSADEVLEPQHLKDSGFRVYLDPGEPIPL